VLVPLCLGAAGATCGLGCSLIGLNGLTGGIVGDDAAADGATGDETIPANDASAPSPDAQGGGADAFVAILDAGGGSDSSSADATAPDDSGEPPPDSSADSAPSGVTVDLTATKDSYVQDGTSADTNFGTSTQLVDKSSPSTGYTRISWVGFDTSAYTNVTAAVLRLYVGGLQTTASNTIPVVLYYPPQSSQSWDESTITWNNAPPAGSDVLGTVDVNDPQIGTWVEFDVTAAVAAESSGRPSFMLTSTNAANRAAEFSSREGAYAPVLRITHL
jgi:hypothetical protein